MGCARPYLLFDDKMWNGYDATLVDVNGAEKNGIEKVKDKMFGRGVLLDGRPPRWRIDCLEEGMAITNEDLDAHCRRPRGSRSSAAISSSCAPAMMERCLAEGEWGGYAGGDAPGLAVRDRRMDPRQGDRRDLHADTWGCEVRPNETEEAQPAVGIGWSFPRSASPWARSSWVDLQELADDCADDGVYEFLSSAPRRCRSPRGSVRRSTRSPSSRRYGHAGTDKGCFLAGR